MKERENAFLFIFPLRVSNNRISTGAGWTIRQKELVYIYCIYLTKGNKGASFAIHRLMKWLLLYLASCATYRIFCRGNKQGLAVVAIMSFKTRCCCCCCWRTPLFVGSCQFSLFFKSTWLELLAARSEEPRAKLRSGESVNHHYTIVLWMTRVGCCCLSVNLVCSWAQRPLYSLAFCFLSSRYMHSWCDAHCATHELYLLSSFWLQPAPSAPLPLLTLWVMV